jgi:hypothetical protein
LIDPFVDGLEPGRKFALPLGLFLGHPKFMAKSIRDIPKKKSGRPSTGGRREGVMVRLAPDQFEALDAWIAKQSRPLTRPEAIRAMMETILHILAKDPGEKPAKKAKGKR